MFKKTIGLEIDSWYAIDFTRLLGELGLEFRFGDEQYHIDERDSRRKQRSNVCWTDLDMVRSTILCCNSKRLASEKRRLSLFYF